MGEKNTTPVSKKPTAIPFSLESDRVKDEIRNRILEVREKCGCTNNEQFSLFLFGDKSSSKTIDSWTLGEKVTTPSLPSLVTISLKAGVSLDWLIFGEKETQEAVEKEKVINEEKIIAMLTGHLSNSKTKEIEEKKTVLIESLLNNDRPVLQACASFLNLLRYSNISLEEDYDIDNIEIPQSLTIKIIPKLFDVKGHFDKENCEFNCSAFGNCDSHLLFWDYRTTLIQRFIALSLSSLKRSCFNEKALLDSATQFMNKHGGGSHYYTEFDRFGENRAHGLSHYSIDDVTIKYTVMNHAYPLSSSIFNDDEPVRITNYCNGEKVPTEIKIYGRLPYTY